MKPLMKAAMTDTLLLVFAFVFFVMAAIGFPTGRFNMIGAGLACYIATLLFHGLN
jgi:hypothetical protein